MLAQMTADQRIVQVQARGITESYELYLIARDNSGNLMTEAMLVSNIDMPGDFKTYIADLHYCGEYLQLDVLDDPFVRRVPEAFFPKVQQRRLPHAEYQALVAGHAQDEGCLPNNSFKGMPLRGTP